MNFPLVACNFPVGKLFLNNSNAKSFPSNHTCPECISYCAESFRQANNNNCVHKVSLCVVEVKDYHAVKSIFLQLYESYILAKEKFLM
jgi:hypothetical protein